MYLKRGTNLIYSFTQINYMKNEKKIIVQYINEAGQTITARVNHEHLVRLLQKYQVTILK
jgi:hypothetical protein